ncbi:MAG: hypothetical protein DKM23_00040 [Candidatus Melainabacteria bacterium]|nr:MAG: hypothetical protein DKM23_00040 [Candidatus Melainabacteria bacterium]
MEIKAQLEKPYTEEQRLQFIVNINHKLGYALEETETHLNAMGYNEEELRQQERERLDKLSMTRGDVFEALILAKGLEKPKIRAMIENAKLDTMTKALYLNRFDEALDFYRGFPIFNMLGQVLGVTPKQLDDFFETKDYHYLTNITLKINATPENAVVTINGKETKEFSTPYQPNLQLPVTYSVSCEGYVTKEDEIVLSKNTVLDVVLDEKQWT